MVFSRPFATQDLLIGVLDAHADKVFFFFSTDLSGKTQLNKIRNRKIVRPEQDQI
jgi:hypothetical protein